MYMYVGMHIHLSVYIYVSMYVYASEVCSLKICTTEYYSHLNQLNV
jgi:hypothetical protein